MVCKWGCSAQPPTDSAVVFYLQYLTEPALSAFYPRLNVVWPLRFLWSTSLLPSPVTGRVLPSTVLCCLGLLLPVERGRPSSLSAQVLSPTPSVGFSHVWVRFWFWFGFSFVARTFVRQDFFFFLTYLGKHLKAKEREVQLVHLESSRPALCRKENISSRCFLWEGKYCLARLSSPRTQESLLSHGGVCAFQSNATTLLGDVRSQNYSLYSLLPSGKQWFAGPEFS